MACSDGTTEPNLRLHSTFRQENLSRTFFTKYSPAEADPMSSLHTSSGTMK